MKRFIYSVLAFIMLFTFAADSAAAVTTEDINNITTPHILLMDAETGGAIYEKNADEKAYPASTTKILTAIVAIENIDDMNKTLTVRAEDVSGFGPNSSLMGLSAGEEITFKDVLYGLMLKSGNDASKVIAYETAGSMDAFIELMNAKATELGMVNSHFVNTSGLHDEDHYSTARDMGTLMRYAMKNSDFCALMATETYQIPANNKKPNGYFLENTNKLIHQKEEDAQSFIYPYCIGGKTGETNFAGYCLVSVAQKDNQKLICVLLGDKNDGSVASTYRFQSSIKLFDWGFENATTQALSDFNVSAEFSVQTINYSPYDPDNGLLNASCDISSIFVSGTGEYIQTLMNTPGSITAQTRLDTEAITAPVEAGDIIGSVDYYANGTLLATAQLVASRNVAAASEQTPEPHETSFISSTPPPGSGKNCNLSVQKSIGSPEYCVWIYYQNSLYTMTNTEWHYMYLDGEVFRAASAFDNAGSIQLYEQLFDTSGSAYYRLASSAVDGRTYVIVSDGRALMNSRNDGTLGSAEVTVNADGTITSQVRDELLWSFTTSSNGYLIRSSNGRYISRKAGSGLLFWILIAVLILVAFIIIRLLLTRGRRRLNHGRMRRSRYRVYR